MRFRSTFGFVIFVLILVGAIIASQPSSRQSTPTHPVFFTDRAAGYVGRPLSPGESTKVAAAIDSIRKPPPDSIAFKDTNGVIRKVSCKDLADLLQSQLNKQGGIEVETENTDIHGATQNNSRPGTADDRINIADDIFSFGDPLHLEETMVHEAIHKGQTTQSRNAGEMEATGAEVAYKESCHVAANDGMYVDAKKAFAFWYGRWQGDSLKRAQRPRGCPPAVYYISFDATAGGLDSFCTFLNDCTTHFGYPLFPMRASDLMLFCEPPTLPPGHVLALLCGGMPGTGIARIVGYDMLDGEIVGTVDVNDFGPPMYPQLFFFSMTRDPTTGMYFALDTLGHQIVSMEDVDGDLIPDLIMGPWANAGQPGFEILEEARGVDAGTHPMYGFGIIVNSEEAHLFDLIYPYEMMTFLPDADGLPGADDCLPVPRYEFLEFSPSIMEEELWAGDMEVSIYGTWDHDIEVWATDSLGEPTREVLGVVHMIGGVDMVCPLLRPLIAGEYVLPLDVISGERPNLPTAVIDPTPREVTLYYLPGGLVRLLWEAVPRAVNYFIYESDTPTEFPPLPQYVSATNELILPLLPGRERSFYQVTALK